MKKLSDNLSIEEWKIIAQEIQKLELPAGYYYDGCKFRSQLKKLRSALSKLNIELVDGYTSTDNNSGIKEVGLATLLEDVSSITAPINYEQASFYEKIYKLATIGIKSISFNPNQISRNNFQISRIPDLDDTISVKKIYTDGQFELTSLYSDKYIQEYEIENIQDANFILQYDITYCENRLRINSSHAIIKSFNGNNFPSVKEIKRPEIPRFTIVKSGINCYKEDYGIITTENIRRKIGYPLATEKGKYYYKK